jgi:hypothetical protein
MTCLHILNVCGSVLGEVFSYIGASVQPETSVRSICLLVIFITFLYGPISQMLAELFIILQAELRMRRKKRKRNGKEEEGT